jgi:hypothetical protein
MPVTYRFDENIIVIELSGEYSVDEMSSVVIEAFQDSARSKNSVLMIDLTNSRSIYQRSSETIIAVAHFIGSYGHQFNNRLALVAPDDFKFGMMRMSSVSADKLGIKVEIFREFNKAKEWLLTA